METLAVKYRPKTFDDMIEQNVIKAILKNQINTDDIRNCYLFCGPPGCGKAQPMYSKILTPDGFIEMKDVKIGTNIFTRNGDRSVVTDIFPQGIRDIYEIQFNDGTSIRVADNHLNSVFRYNQDTRKREDFVLSTMDLLNLFKKTRFKLRVDLPVVKFEEQDVPLDPYLLGCLLGDGGLHDSFGFSNAKQDIIDKVNEKLDKYNCHLKYKENYDYSICRNTSSFKYFYTYKGKEYKGPYKLIEDLIIDGYPKFDPGTILKLSNNNAKVTLNKYPELKDAIKSVKNENYEQCNEVRRIIKSLGLNVSSKNKFIPSIYLFNSKDIRLQILQGLYDTDGYTNGKCGETIFSTSSKQLSDDFAFLVRSLGCRDTVKVSDSSYTNSNGIKVECGKHYSHYIKIPNDLLYCSSKKHLSRRKERQSNPIKTIIDIIYIGKEECQCIYVQDDDHTYITDNFVPTHNTTSARAFARQICSEQNAIITELDAASHNGVDDVRKLIEDSKFKPIGQKYKVYILDEAHMLTNSAWAALLKVTEEPTPTSIFIFATTDPQKIPSTILSRIQRYDFQRITQNGIVNRLKYILDCENNDNNCNYTFEEEALNYIAKLADGGMRDSITLMEKVLGYSNCVNMENVVKALGTVDYSTMFDLTDYICKMDKKSVIELIETIHSNGLDLKQFIKNYNYFVLDLCKYGVLGSFDYLQMPSTCSDRIKKYTKEDFAFFTTLLNEVINLNTSIKWESTPKPIIESTFILLCSEA